jgi:hypothetical protein
MAKSKDYGFNPASLTPITGFQPFLLTADSLVVKEDEPDRVVVESKTSPYERPERWEFGWTTISNMYKSTSVDIASAARPVTAGGVQLLVKYRGFMQVTDPDDSAFLNIIPIDMHSVVRVPINSYVTASDIVTYLKRQIGAFFEDTGATSARIDELIRSALRPTV